MAAPIAVVAFRFVVVRGGAAVGRKIVTTFGKKTAARRMQSEAAKRGGQALAPAPQGPYGRVLTESRGGEHTSRSRTPETRKSIRGPSANTRSRKRRTPKSRYFRRDEDRYRGRRPS